MNHKLTGIITLASVLVVGSVLQGCSTSVERLDSAEVVDISGDWNDTDSRLVSEEMIADVLSRPWISNFINKQGHQPTVIVGEIRNLSHEHINVNTFVGDMERELINSGKVEFVASSSERGEIREERRDQELNSTQATANPMGREIGADFMLKGSINTIIDKEGKKSVRYYQVDLTLISMADNRKVWLGQKKIKKLVKKPGLRW
ncbi:MAG TPA: penicillin-binding protein activator LpoB [Candidatus Tenderia electrophaga]|uniref:Penicillin-binding protein activator LpoB n=1 Tax=Candidatus Tenderia electrophaga TaxID=1748243 RepID=A0A832J7T2_9GAMM|nr:penicillin-binding protein activator LpoB [Candidatus Tenderia electrophaga]